jgi:hypothetical protein
MITEVIQSRLALHQARFDHIEHLMSNYSEVNWPGGGEKKFKKDFYERMVLKGIIQELKHILELKNERTNSRTC